MTEKRYYFTTSHKQQQQNISANNGLIHPLKGRRDKRKELSAINLDWGTIKIIINP